MVIGADRKNKSRSIYEIRDMGHFSRRPKLPHSTLEFISHIFLCLILLKIEEMIRLYVIG